MADEKTWNPKTSRFSIHSIVGRRQDGKMKLQMFGGRKVPKEMISFFF